MGPLGQDLEHRDNYREKRNVGALFQLILLKNILCCYYKKRTHFDKKVYTKLSSNLKSNLQYNKQIKNGNKMHDCGYS